MKNNIAKYVFFAIVALSFLGCEDKKSQSKIPVSEVETTSEQLERKNKKKDSLEEEEIEVEEDKFPVLTDDNAMEFFLQYDKKHKEDKVKITTDFGEIVIQLYPETKFHRSNFIYLTKRGYFDDTQFYRVVNNFIIQGGSTDDPDVMSKRGDIGKYLLPKDTQHGFKHHRGVVSMPSSEIANPYKLASPYEFFIVQKPGGSYHLDGDYTAFGRVIEGMDVVDEIAAQETDKAEWPLHNVYIRKVEIVE